MRYSIMSVQDHYPGRERTVPELYEQILVQGETAEALGYHTFFMAEHHFHEYGTVPNPSVMLSSMAQRTTRLRLGTAISVLTFHNPLIVAENYAMLDVLSGGRVVLGVGSGYLKHEFDGFNVDPAEKRERFDESLEVLRRALSGDRVTFKGQYIQVEDVGINVLPIQQPTPPIYVAALRREAAYHIGKKGQRILCVPYASIDNFDDINGIVTDFRKGQSDGGVPPQEDDILITLHTHIAEDDGAARTHAAAAFELYVDTRLYAKRQSFDQNERSGLSLIGDAENVRQKLEKLASMGLNHILAWHNFGLLGQDLVLDSMRRFADLAQQIGENPQQKSRVA
jgi:alkanesulfonate monooxygenase SsuD/methylene tetrahydromethanopterin reductase-like flavin-dependent oxidoreductase (luciferase family)